MRAISLTSAILLTRTYKLLVQGRKFFLEKGVGGLFERAREKGGGGGAYDCYHLV